MKRTIKDICDENIESLSDDSSDVAQVDEDGITVVRDKFMFFKSYLKAFNILPNDRLKVLLIEGMTAYAFDGIPFEDTVKNAPDLDDTQRVLLLTNFVHIEPLIDSSLKTSTARAIAGAKGGRSKKNK